MMVNPPWRHSDYGRDEMEFDRCKHCHGQIYKAVPLGWRHVRGDRVWCLSDKTKAEPK